ncbi:hypothetical protein Tco_0521169 [Tanacetum coccineum]
MPSQTRSTLPVFEDIVIGNLRYSLMAFMRQEMDKFRAELRNTGTIEKNGGTMVRQKAEGQRAMHCCNLKPRMDGTQEGRPHSKPSCIAFGSVRIVSEFLRFGREDVRGSTFRCEQFFKLDHVADEGENEIRNELEECLGEEIVWEQEPVVIDQEISPDLRFP